MSKGIGALAQESHDDDETSVYEDRHWRKICLHPMGQMWRSRVEAMVHAVTLQGSIAGMLQRDKVDFQFTYTCSDPPSALQACALHLNKDMFSVATCSLYT